MLVPHLGDDFLITFSFDCLGGRPRLDGGEHALEAAFEALAEADLIAAFMAGILELEVLELEALEPLAGGGGESAVEEERFLALD